MKEKLIWEKMNDTWVLRFANATGGLAYLAHGLVWYVYSPTLGKGSVNLEAEDLDEAKDMASALALRWLHEVASDIEEQGPP